MLKVTPIWPRGNRGGTGKVCGSAHLSLWPLLWYWLSTVLQAERTKSTGNFIQYLSSTGSSTTGYHPVDTSSNRVGAAGTPQIPHLLLSQPPASLRENFSFLRGTCSQHSSFPEMLWEGLKMTTFWGVLHLKGSFSCPSICSTLSWLTLSPRPTPLPFLPPSVPCLQVLPKSQIGSSALGWCLGTTSLYFWTNLKDNISSFLKSLLQNTPFSLIQVLDTPETQPLRYQHLQG